MSYYCNCGDHLYDHLIRCPFCGCVKISDNELLEYVLDKINVNYDVVKKEYAEMIKDTKTLDFILDITKTIKED